MTASVQAKSKVFAYIRVSSLAQDVEGTSLKAQAGILKEYITKYIGYKLGESGEWDGRFFSDTCTSRINLINRPAGYTLMHSINPGDHICVVGWDRLFRNMKDAGLHLNEFWDHGITIHDTRSDIDMSTPMGRMMAMQLILFAEMEQGLRQERIGAVRRYRRERGLPVGAFPPLGWDYIGKGKDRVFKICKRSRELGAEIAELRDVKGYSYAAIELHYWHLWNKAPAKLKQRYEAPRRMHSERIAAINVPLHAGTINRLYWGHKTGWPVHGVHKEMARIRAAEKTKSEPGDISVQRGNELAAAEWRERRNEILLNSQKLKKGFKPKQSQTLEEVDAA